MLELCVLPADCCSSVVYSSLWIAGVYMLKGYINHWTGGKNRQARLNTDVSLRSAYIYNGGGGRFVWVKEKQNKGLIVSPFLLVHIQ